jgi:hypothetical protein
VAFAVELRNDGGRVISAYSTERQATDKPKSPSVYTVSPRITLKDVPPGRYALHVDARSSLDKRRSLTGDIPITVR